MFGEPIDIEKKGIDIFPEMKPLLNFDGGEVQFNHKEKKYIISSFADDTEKGKKKMCFGLWEELGSQRVPVGFFDASFVPSINKVCLDVKMHDEFKNLPDKFKNLDNIGYDITEVHSGMAEKDAVAVDLDYRHTGIADILNAQTLVVFQALGATEVAYFEDQTVRSASSNKHIPQFKNIDGLIQNQHHTPSMKSSFYSKWSMSHEIDEIPDPYTKTPVYITRIIPHLSSLQISMLNEIGMKPVEERNVSE
ncbi:MAG: hypothetical protein UX02_C0009G0004 [Candidatus Moranbacteria bacterium GW2011_GWC1_45_18]|uniref:Uncharacterized protein n=1 Tax=Candidatus Collierbacteria bacterium GW2011_GWB1_44_6 TaxID=1618384 RepID=A0A0G1JLR1_9BACT|nr:MAG: hypothetical protein UW68_C0040G0005 [Candidatus Collierbacteria bacterium GW2011_GWB1_44_6]KKT98972.1 MAG: hypothetical protein UX02_C0009G0004 [Candidatus Moranbacteria bacterium GW2011_GWC1_45_18]